MKEAKNIFGILFSGDRPLSREEAMLRHSIETRVSKQYKDNEISAYVFSARIDHPEAGIKRFVSANVLRLATDITAQLIDESSVSLKSLANNTPDDPCIFLKSTAHDILSLQYKGQTEDSDPTIGLALKSRDIEQNLKSRFEGYLALKSIN